MFPCMSPEGARGAIAWYIGTRILGDFDAGIAACKARMAADPTYKPNPFADKPKGVRMTTKQAIDAICADVRARRIA